MNKYDPPFKFAFITVLLLSLQLTVLGQTDNAFKLFLIGDAGEREVAGTTLKTLEKNLLGNPNSAVIFLGDNSYKSSFFTGGKIEIKGFDKSPITCRRVMAQVNCLRNYKGSAFFVPGNHDWWNSLSIKHGLKGLKMEEKFIVDSTSHFPSLRNRATGVFLPSGGETGPVTRELNNQQLKLIFIDTYRLILEKDKGHGEVIRVFMADFAKILQEAADKKQIVVVLAHHPVFAKGKHSQEMPPAQKKIKHAANSNLTYPPYAQIAAEIDSIIVKSTVTDLYYVSGHEHSLEYFYRNHRHYIVSGAGSKTDHLQLGQSCNENECLIWNEEGFFEIEFSDKKQKISVIHGPPDQENYSVKCLKNCKE